MAEKLQTEDIKGVEIFATGKWNGDEYTQEDLDKMIEAFNEKVIEPPVKLGHDDHQNILKNSGLPAAGWVERLYRRGEKLLADIKQVPKKIAELIKAGAYKKVSSEILWNYEINGKVYPRVLNAVAFLGAAVPAVTSLKDILANYSVFGNGRWQTMKMYQMDNGNQNQKDEKNPPQDWTEEEVKQLVGGAQGISIIIGRKKGESTTSTQSIVFSKDKWTLAEAKKWLADHGKRADKVDETENSYRFRQEEPDAFEEGSLRTIQATQDENQITKKQHQEEETMEKVQELEKKLNESDEKVRKYEQEVQQLKDEMRRKENEAWIKERLGKKILPSEKEYVSHLLDVLTSAPQLKVYEQKNEKLTSADVFKKLFDMRKDFQLTGEKMPFASDVETLQQAARRIQQERKCSYEQAVKYAMDENPDFKKQYTVN